MKKRMISLILSLTLLLSLSVSAFAAAPTVQPHVTDVPTSHGGETQREPILMVSSPARQATQRTTPACSLPAEH